MDDTFKVIIAGGRDYDDYESLEKYCNYLLKNKKNIEIVCGLANGADLLGEKYGKKYGFKISYFPAKWEDFSEPCVIKTRKDDKKYNALAGHNRNRLMAEYANAAIIFWDGKSRGSKNMINLSKEKNLLLRIYNY